MLIAVTTNVLDVSNPDAGSQEGLREQNSPPVQATGQGLAPKRRH